MKKTMYADTVNGVFDMTKEDLILRIKENPYFTHPEDIAFVDTDDVEYTGKEALDMAGMKNEEI